MQFSTVHCVVEYVEGNDGTSSVTCGINPIVLARQSRGQARTSEVFEGATNQLAIDDTMSAGRQSMVEIRLYLGLTQWAAGQ